MKYINKIIGYATLLFVFLVPYQARWIIESGEINGGYWEYGTKSLYATEALLFLILAAIAVKGLLVLKKKNWGIRRQDLVSLRGALILMVTWAGLSIFWAYDKSVALEHWVILVEAVAVFFILLSNIVSSEKLFWALALSAGSQAALGLEQFFTQTILASTWLGMASQEAGSLGPAVVETATGRFLRAYGTFPHPNILGGYLVLGLLVIFNKLKEQIRFSVQKRSILLGLVILITGGLAASFSRSAWLALAAAWAYFLLSSWLDKQFKFALKVTAVMAAVAIIFGAIYPNLLLARFGSATRLELKSSAERAALTSDSLKIIKSHMLIGAGFGNYGLANQAEVRPDEPAWYYQPVHNFFLLVWAELGLVGLAIVLCSLWFLAFRFAFRPEARRISLFLLPVFVISLFDHYLWSLYPGLLLLGLYIRFSNPENMANVR